MAKRRHDGKWEEPEALRHLRETFTEEMARKTFFELRGRSPHSESELEVFVEWYTIEAYNGGTEHWPELRKSK
ncbi:MAG TPA: hypothetical protein VHS31_04115 [Tepidisphaeraceae bacterium]|jgi:hypothetical protein|nr:hypothetical protein [Tepidisphaeraceae bacterium]